MHGDFSRVTFRPGKHYSAVLAQQGRVQLDADANEQAAIELHRLRTLAADLVGRHGGPATDAGFRIEYRPRNHEADDLAIGSGRYYVDGILCDATRPAPGTPAPADGVWRNDPAPGDTTAATWTYWDQPDAYRDPELAADRLPDTFPYLVYLKVWERAVGAVEDPDLREVALGAAMPDTAARAKLIWQVLALPGSELDAPDGGAETIRTAFDTWADQHTAPTALLAARSRRPDRADDDACLVRPDARYRGPENQLYRVEIHHGATAAEGATFKWSRENGSVVFPLAGFTATWAELATLGEDPKLSLDVGDWVEVCDSAYLDRGEPAPLLRIEEVDLPGRRVRLSGEPVPGVGRVAGRHPFLRRWDHTTPSGRSAPDTGRRRAAPHRGRMARPGGRRPDLLPARRHLPHRRPLDHPGPHDHGHRRVAGERRCRPAAPGAGRRPRALRAARLGDRPAQRPRPAVRLLPDGRRRARPRGELTCRSAPSRRSGC